MLRSNTVRLFLVLIGMLSFSIPYSFSLTESVDLFGEINSIDLILNDIWIEPENPKEGETVTVYGSVYNAGIISPEMASDAITAAYIVNGEIREITLMENVLPGTENGIVISSGPLFDAVSGKHIITVIINYHDTLSHLRDNPENNIVQKVFQVGNNIPSLITAEIYQHYDNNTDRQRIKVQGELTDIFQEKLQGREISVDIKGILQEKITTDTNGKFLFETEIQFKNESIEIAIDLEEEHLLLNQSHMVFPVKVSSEEAVLALKITSEKEGFDENTRTIVIFQDSYDNVFREITTDNDDNQNLIINDFLVTVLPANHEYIIETYVEGRVQESFQTYFPSNAVIKKEIIISESAQIQFRIVDELMEPQNDVTVDNWIYSGKSNDEGMTDWIKVIPTFTPNEPYVARATFPNGKVVWSEPFTIEPEEKKTISIVKRSSNP